MKLQINAKKLYSVAMALLLSTPLYIVFMETLGVARSNTTMLFMVVILAVLILAAFSSKNIHIDKQIVIISCSLVAIFMMSVTHFDEVNYTLLQFGFYVLVPAYIVSQDFEYEAFFRYIIILSIPSILSLDIMLALDNIGLNQGEMYSIYAFLPHIIAVLTHFLHWKEQSNFIIKIGYIVGVYYIIRIFPVAVRGFILSVLVYVILEVVMSAQRKKKKEKKMYYIVIMVSLFALILLIVNIEAVCSWLLDINTNVGFLIKTAHLLEENDISNGRTSIYIDALKCFWESPVFGHGIDGISLWSNGQINYPHNSVLQLIVDGGILFGLPSIVIVIVSIYRIFVDSKSIDVNKRVFAVYLTSIGMISSFLSGDVWKNAAFWIAVFFYVRYIWLGKFKVV